MFRHVEVRVKAGLKKFKKKKFKKKIKRKANRGNNKLISKVSKACNRLFRDKKKQRKTRRTDTLVSGIPRFRALFAADGTAGIEAWNLFPIFSRSNRRRSPKCLHSL